MRVYKYTYIPKLPNSCTGNGYQNEVKILNLPSIKKAKKFLPKTRSESALFKYDGTSYYQWHYRSITWYPVGPVFKIVRSK